MIEIRNLTKIYNTKTGAESEELRRARLKIVMIFQHFYLISQKTVFENV